MFSKKDFSKNEYLKKQKQKDTPLSLSLSLSLSQKISENVDL